MLTYTTISSLMADVHAINHWLAPHYARDTAAPGTSIIGSVQSSGHCAVAAMILRSIFGGDLVSTTVKGESHWFNRIDVNGFILDVDITGDQFGLEAIQVGPADALYDTPARIRESDEVEQGTHLRAVILAERAHIPYN